MSKMLSWNIFICKGTYMTDWVGQIMTTCRVLYLSDSARRYESCKIFKGQPRRNANSKLVHRQHKSFPADRFCQVEIQNTTGLSNKPSTA